MPRGRSNAFNNSSNASEEQYLPDLSYTYQRDTADDPTDTNCSPEDLRAGVRKIGYISDTNCRVRFDYDGSVYRVNEDLRDKFWPSFAHPRFLSIRQLYSQNENNENDNNENHFNNNSNENFNLNNNDNDDNFNFNYNDNNENFNLNYSNGNNDNFNSNYNNDNYKSNRFDNSSNGDIDPFN